MNLILNYSRDNAISPFLMEGTPENYLEFVRESPKVQYVVDCIESVKKYHEERNEMVSGQVIYMNRGKEFMKYIQEYLLKEVGFSDKVFFSKKRFSEVEIITGEVSPTKKEAIVEAFLEGVVKVILGTATIREGIDLQKNGSVVYNLFPDWNPTDIRQLEGRVWRQGNKFGYIRSVMPLVQDSMDVFIFQKLEEKTARINDIWFRGDRGNVLDVESLDPSEVKMALITDVDRIVKMIIDDEKATLSREYRRINGKIATLGEIKDEIIRYQGYLKKVMDHLVKFKNHLEGMSDLWADFKIEDDREGQKRHKDRQNKAKKLLDAIRGYLEATDRADKDLIAVMRRIQTTGNEFGFSTMYLRWDLQYFKSSVTKVRKAERNILKPKGYTIESDIEKVIREYADEARNIQEQAKGYTHIYNAQKDEITSEPTQDIKLTKRYREIVNEVRQKKSTLNVDGKTPSQRAEEFSSLNYLLNYLAADVDSNQFNLPDEPEDEPSPGPKQRYMIPAKFAPDDPKPDDLELIEMELELEAMAAIALQIQDLELQTA